MLTWRREERRSGSERPIDGMDAGPTPAAEGSFEGRENGLHRSKVRMRSAAASGVYHVLEQ